MYCTYLPAYLGREYGPDPDSGVSLPFLTYLPVSPPDTKKNSWYINRTVINLSKFSSHLLLNPDSQEGHV